MAEVHNLPFSHSNHKLVKMALSPFQVWVRRTGSLTRGVHFHFEEIWALDEECKNLVQDFWWEGDALNLLEGMMDKLHNCAFFLWTPGAIINIFRSRKILIIFGSKLSGSKRITDMALI